jgi:hypothetical protein
VLAGGGRVLPWQMGSAADQAHGSLVDLRGTLGGGGAPHRPMLGPTGVEPDPLSTPVFETSDALPASFERAPTGTKLAIYLN